MTTKPRAILFALLFAGAGLSMAGCGDDDLEELAKDPHAACDAFVDKFCEEWAVPCLGGLTYEGCVRSAETEFPGGCGGALATSSRYVECMNDMDSMTCDDDRVPTSCNGVILF